MIPNTKKVVQPRNRNKGRSKGQPVAGNAVVGEPNRKKVAALKSRRLAYSQSKGTGVGGHRHHNPGSMQGHLG
jgi:hypothetical protein